MTWTEFKKNVDEELEAFENKDPQIFYIDTVTFPDKKLHVSVGEYYGLVISGGD